MRKILVQLGAFVVAGFLLWGLVAWRDRQMLERLRNEMGIARRDSVIQELGHEVMRKDTVYLEGRTVFQNVAANPTSTKPQVVEACNAVILSCDARIQASDVLADSMRAQIEALRELKAKKPPRFSAYALAGFDWMNNRPIGQAGADFRIVGPLSLTGFLETAQGNTTEKLSTRGVLATRFTFR